MRTYTEAYDAALDESAFSNGTEGYAWMDEWCYRCVNDGNHEDTGCPLVLVALMGRTPSEWIRQPGFRLGDTYHCVEFRSEDDGPDPEPQPIPDPPGQGLLWPREPFEGVRMFVGAETRVPA